MPQQSSLLGGLQAATGVLGTISGIEVQKAQEERLRRQAETEAGLTPLRRQLLEAQVQKMRQQTEHPGLSLTGLPQISRQREYIENLKREYGEESPRVKEAQKDLDLNIHNLQSQLHYREELAKFLPKRGLTSISKALLEKEAIARGLSPTGEMVSFPGEEPVVEPIKPKVEGTPAATPALESKVAKMSEEDLKNAEKAPFGSDASAALDLYLSKQAGLGDNTKKLSYGAVLEKTLDLMSPYRTSMAYYSGAAGKARYAKDVALSQTTGQLTPQLRNFTKFLETATSTLVPQITQYYGASVTEGQQKLLRQVANPADWIKSPERAMVAFDTLINTLENEIQVRRDLVKKPQFLTKEHAKTAPLYEEVKKTGYGFDELVKRADENQIPVMELIKEINRLKGTK
jgi:hypothetical protein